MSMPYTIPGYHKQFTANKYCWIYGSCAHTSTECKTLRPGHKTDATFHNQQGYNTDFAFLSNEGVGLMKIM